MMMLYEPKIDERYELWDNSILLMEPSGPEHEAIAANLFAVVTTHVRRHRLGKVFGSNTAVYLHGDLQLRDFVMPDLTFLRAEKLNLVVPSKGIYGVPDCVVEIVSPGRINVERDQIRKYQLYERCGVPEYWIVHPYDQSLRMYILRDGAYREIAESVILNGLVMGPSDLFE